MYVCMYVYHHCTYITTWQVFRYFTKILLDNISLAIMSKVME